MSDWLKWESQPPKSTEAAPPQEHPALAKGDESEDVRMLQFLLNQWQKPLKGTHKVAVSARLDDATIALMKKFQEKSGLQKSEVPSEETWQALEKASAQFSILGKIHPCKLPVSQRRWYSNYHHEGRLWTRSFPQTAYDGVEGLGGKSGTPILYLTKLSTDDDGTSAGGDSTKQSATTLRYDEAGAPSLNADQIPYLAISGTHTHDYGIQLGDVGAVIFNGKVAYGIYGDSSGAFHEGTATDEDVKKKNALFKSHRSGEASVKLHRLLGLSGGADDNDTSQFIWIVFPGSTFCSTPNRLPRSVDSDAIQKRGAALLKLLGGNP